MGSNRLHSCLCAVAAALAFGLLLGRPAEAQVAITINGNAVDVSPEPIIQAGRVFVPLRGVFENLGASVVYSNGHINATGNGNDISLQIGSTQATVNGSPETIDVAPFIVGASTFVPLRFVSQALGASVSWDGANQVVAITLGNEEASISDPPPPLPEYEQPPVPAPNYIWMPGYWAWGDAGYYWVPGTWVLAPQPGLLWTPGYWAWQSGFYGWHPGYWAIAVGFYGGVNYGAGYYGHGYYGGRWSGDSFRYNTAVTRVTNTTVITNVYVDETVVNNTTINRISYNGGPNGIAARPTSSEAAIAHARHVPMTSVQKEHVQVAAQDRRLLATVNAGKPPVVVAPEPFTSARKPAEFVPVTPEDKQAAKQLIVRPQVHPAVAHPAPPAVAHPAPPAVAHPAPPAVAHPAPPATVRPPVQHSVPAQQLPETRQTMHPAPVRPPSAQPAPVRVPAAPPAPVRLPAAQPAPVHPPSARPTPGRPLYHAPPPVHPPTPRPPSPRPPAHVTPPPKPAPPPTAGAGEIRTPHAALANVA
jgi:hypothetical protein